MPKRKNFHASSFRIDLIVQVVAGAAQKQAANVLLLRVTRPRTDPRLCRNEFKSLFQIIHEGKRSTWAIGSPPRDSAPYLGCSAGREPNGQAAGQSLLAKLSEEGLGIDEMTAGRLLEGLFESGLMLWGQFEGLIGFRDKNRHGDPFLEEITIDFDLALNHLARGDAHVVQTTTFRLPWPSHSHVCCVNLRTRLAGGSTAWAGTPDRQTVRWER